MASPVLQPRGRPPDPGPGQGFSTPPRTAGPALGRLGNRGLTLQSIPGGAGRGRAPCSFHFLRPSKDNRELTDSLDQAQSQGLAAITELAKEGPGPSCNQRPQLVRHLREGPLPFAQLGLAEQPHGRLPRGVRALQQPAPVDNGQEGHPDHPGKAASATPPDVLSFPFCSGRSRSPLRPFGKGS
jgi:hypothetical protein